MEVENISSISSTITTTTNNNNTNYKEEEDDIPLPGFRFHPTDEELVGFYLRRKIEKRTMRIELIKQADIYKYDPWDLPKPSGVGDKEWYFFCKRGRKYRNSTRPNRVTGTGSGFWKATGIDKPIYSSAAGGSYIIGLKKSLVYYRGSAGKGTKTDWMMHEFRLPSSNDGEGGKIADHVVVTKNFAHQEAEVWTICRILKRNVTNKKCVPNWREIQIAASSAKRSTLLINNNIPIVDENYSKVTCSSSIDSSYQNRQIGNYISFTNAQSNYNIIPNNYQQREFSGRNFPSSASSFSSSSNLCANDVSDEFLRHGADWEDLRSVVDCAVVANPFYL